MHGPTEQREIHIKKGNKAKRNGVRDKKCNKVKLVLKRKVKYEAKVKIVMKKVVSNRKIMEPL